MAEANTILTRPPSWKRGSANFASTQFSEVSAEILRRLLSCRVSRVRGAGIGVPVHPHTCISIQDHNT